jgi:hypothetical protein
MGLAGQTFFLVCEKTQSLVVIAVMQHFAENGVFLKAVKPVTSGDSPAGHWWLNRRCPG